MEIKLDFTAFHNLNDWQEDGRIFNSMPRNLVTDFMSPKDIEERYVEFQDYVWGTLAGQQVVVRLGNNHFAQELLCKQHRQAATRGISPLESAAIILGSNTPCLQDDPDL